jgi:hypothetical protein
MSPLTPEICGAVLIGALIGVALCLVIMAPAIRRHEARGRARQQRADTDIAREVRRVRAGPAPAAPEQVPPLSPARRAAIAEDAAACAHKDHAQGRCRANPHLRHSREYVIWSIEYARVRADLDQGPVKPLQTDGKLNFHFTSGDPNPLGHLPIDRRFFVANPPIPENPEPIEQIPFARRP